jgi:type II secretory pathway pseudopilin PulG
MAQQESAVRRRRAARGFTFVEILLASTILVGALLGIASVLPTADMTLHRAGQVSKAVALAQQMLETIKNDPFIDLVNYNGVDTRTTSTWPTDDPNPPVPGAAGNFMGNTNVLRWRDDIGLFLTSGAGITGGFGTINVTTVATDGTNPILRRVTVVVGWTDRGWPYTVQLSTLASAI